MTKQELEKYNQVVQEAQVNKKRLEHSIHGGSHHYQGRKFGKLDHKIENNTKPIQALNSLGIDTNLNHSEPSTSFITPDSGMGLGSSPHDQWEVNVKLVRYVDS